MTLERDENNKKVRKLYAPNGNIIDTQTVNVDQPADMNTRIEETPKYGGLKVGKVDADTSKTSPQGDAKFVGAEFTIYAAEKLEINNVKYEKDQAVKVITTGNDGTASTGTQDLIYGKYYVKETKAPEGYILNTSYRLDFQIREHGVLVDGTATGTGSGKKVNASQELSGWTSAVSSISANDARDKETVISGFAEIIKKAVESVTAQGDASLKGIKYAIVNRSAKAVFVNGEEREVGKVVQVVSTNENGTIKSASLPYGTYDVYELRADSTVAAGDTYDEVTSKYGTSIYANGTGYLFKEKRERVVVREDGKTYEANFINDIVKGSVKLGKIDRENKTNEAQGHATLKDAELTIYNNSKTFVYVNGTKYEKGAAVITVKTDENGIASVGKILPYGTYYVKETKAPEGYLLNSTWRVDFQIREEGVMVDLTQGATVEAKTGLDAKTGITAKTGTLTANEAETPEDIIRADLTFSKIDIDGAKMPYIPFLVQRLDKDGNIVESHVILTDGEGKLSTKDTAKRPKTVANVNVLDQYLEGGTYTGPLDDTAAGYNIWFGELNEDSVRNNRGSLIYATYKVTELKCANNEGQDMLTQDLFKAEDIKEVFTDGKLFEIENIFVDLIIHPESDVLDVTSETMVVSIKENAEVMDKVRWDHLKIGQKYELETVIIYESREGEKRELGRNSIEFTPSKVDITNTSLGVEENTVTVDTSKLNGGTLHAEDYIYALRDGERILIATHNKEHNEPRQMLGVPYMETHASDTRTFDRVGTIHKQAGIIDKIVYENLPNDRMFVIKETIVDRDKPETVIGTAEKVIRVSKRVDEPKEGVGGVLVVPTSGEITMPEITFDASNFNGKTLVVFETLYDYDTDEPYLTHEELSDEEQSIHYIDPVTEALDSKTGTQTGTVGEKEKIIDLVTVSNAIPGMEYKVTGNLVYLEDCVTSDGVSHKKGEVIAEQKEPVTVVAESDVFTVEVEFEVDSRMLEGTSGVVFEDVWHKDVLVGFHHDYSAKPQTPNWPKVRTTALGQSTGTHTLELGDDVDIVDTVELTNLTEGDTYKVIGTLMDEDGNPFMIDGEGFITESEPFTAEEKNMTIDITFTINTLGLEGKSLVVYEKLIHIGEKDVLDEEGNPTGETEPNETEVTRHEDPTDEGQTVNILEGRTTATDSKTGDHVGTVGEKEIINDKVSLKKLRIGETYTIKGDLHYQEDFKDKDGVMHLKGDVVKDADGNVITAEKTFTANAKEMNVTLTFEVNSELLRGARIVVFEKGYQGKTLVFSHADVDDPDQRVDEPDIRTTLISELTGDHVGDTENETVMVDTVELKNLVVGLEYTVRGVLMDKKTGEPVPNVKTEPVIFTAKEGDTTVDITFRLSGKDRENRTTVAFEELIHNNVVVVSHKDLDDGNQTVWTPSVITEAKDEETGANVGRAREETVIVDKITLKNLIKGREYIVTGYLMDQSTGEKYIDADGKEVMGTPITFKATKSTEVKEMTFKFNGSNLKGKTVTVFEDLYHNDVIVAAHRDINSASQSVYYPDDNTEPKEPPKTVPKTGDSNSTVMFISLFMLAICISLLAASGTRD